MTTLTYRQARWIVLGFGSALVAAVALSAYLRGADPVEVGAVALFLPILWALAYGRARAGVVAAVAVSALYLAIRFTSLPDELDPTEFLGAALVRVLLYVGLGLFGGWANELLEHALEKLELYDEVDDLTGVGNTRALLAITDRELARARRYDSVFSVSVLELDRRLFASVDERRAGRTLRRFCQLLENSVRRTDLVARVPFDDHEEVVVVLPETGPEGALRFQRLLEQRARDTLGADGLPAANGLVTTRRLSIPGDEDALGAYARALGSVADGLQIDVEDRRGDG